MKILSTIIGLSLLAILCAGVWVLRYRPQWIQPTVADAGDDEDVDPQKLEIPVHSATVKIATLHRYVEAFGTVEPAPPRPGRMAGTADVAAPVAGVISQVLVEAGKQVKQGDPLIQLDDRVTRSNEAQAAAALAEEQAAVEKARGEVEFAQHNYARQKTLAPDGGIPQKTLEQAAHDLSAANGDLAVEEAKLKQAQAALDAARTQREILRITSPIDATVVAINGNPGEAADTTKVLVDLVALDRLVVNVSIPAQEAATLTPGMTAEISLTSSGADAKSSPGKIYFVGSEVNGKSNTIPIGIDIDPALGAKAGQSVHVRIVAEEHKDVTAVPKESVVSDENGDTFIALISGDQATHKTVKAGIREGDLVEVQADGLKDGDAIVASGAYGLAKFQVAKIKVVEK